MNVDVRTLPLRNVLSSKQQKQQNHYRTNVFKISILAIVAFFVWEILSLSDDTDDWSVLVDPPPRKLDNTSLQHLDHHTPPRYVTVILPSVVNPTGRRKRLEAIAKTWGPAARAVYVLHSQDEYGGSSNGIDTDHPYPHTILVPESITVANGVPRLQYVLQAILDRYDPEFTFFVNDHTYVLPQNACQFLRDRSPNEHLYAGHALSNSNKFAFNSGAAGYFLSRKSLRGLVEHWSAGVTHCSVGGGDDTASKWLQGNPGLVTAECLGLAMGVEPLDTRDEGGRHLFHAFGLVRTVTGEVDQWYLNKHEGLDKILGDDTLHHHQPMNFKECCSSDTISFHYVESAETLALTSTLRKIAMTKDSSISVNPLSDDYLKDYMISLWPKEHKDVGGYAHRLPHKNAIDGWDNLLFVTRNIALGVDDAPCFA